MVRARNRWQVEFASGSKVNVDIVAPDCNIHMKYFSTSMNLRVIPLGLYDIVLGMDWLEQHQAIMDFKDKTINYVDDFGSARVIAGIKGPISLRTISTKQLARCVKKGCILFAILINDLEDSFFKGSSLNHPIL